MTTLERSIHINTTPDVYGDYVDQIARWPEWYTGMESATSVDEMQTTGSHVDVIYKAGGMTFDMTVDVLDHVPNQLVVHQLGGMVSGTNTWTTSPDTGGTTVIAHFEYEIPGGVLGRIADKLIVERMNAENLEKSLQNIKTALEGG